MNFWPSLFDELKFLIITCLYTKIFEHALCNASLAKLETFCQRKSFLIFAGEIKCYVHSFISACFAYKLPDIEL